jgi:hypothetical protein
MTDLRESMASEAPSRKRPGRMVLLAVAVGCVALGLSIAALISSLTGGTESQSPTTSSVAPSEPVTIPNVLGMQTAGAEAALTAAGLSYTVTETVSTNVAAGLVSEESPSAGSQIQKSGSVNLTVSSGP